MIIKARPNRIPEVVEQIRPFVERVHELMPRIMAPEITPFTPYPMRVIQRFSMVTSILPREVIYALADGPYVEKIFHDQTMYAFAFPMVPDEGIFSAPHRILKEIQFTSTFWTRRLMGADLANEKGFYGDGVLVSITDTGASRVHEMIRRVQFETTMGQHRDENGHGSWCTSCVGGVRMRDDYLSQRARREVLCEGMAPRCDLLAVKCLGYFIGAGCFSGNHWVTVSKDRRSPGGFRRISRVKVNDKIINYNTEMEKLEEDRVTKVFKREMSHGERVFEVKADDGTILYPTEEHLFLVELSSERRDWVQAKDLQVGMHLINVDMDQKYKVPQAYFALRKPKPSIRGEKNPSFKPKVKIICKGCGETFEVRPSEAKRKYCSQSCYLKTGNPGENFLKYYSRGRKPWNYGKPMDDETRKLVSIKVSEAYARGHKPWNKGLTKYDDERLMSTAKKNRVYAIISRQKVLAKGYRTTIEHLLESFIEEMGLGNYKIEFPIFDKNNELICIADLAFPKLKVALFADGAYWHGTLEVKNKDEVTNSKLVEEGWFPLRFTEEELQNEVILIKDPIITSVKEIKSKYVVWDLETEKNHTIIVNGVIVHNSTSNIISAIDMSLERKADIISMSLGGDVETENPQDDPYYSVFEEAVKEGVIPVVACGNSGPGSGTVGTPGALPQPITVGAYDPVRGSIAEYSSRGPAPWGTVKPDCVAPGSSIDSGICGVLDTSGDGVPSRYSPISGTSMATPHCSGLLALMMEAHRKVLGKRLTVAEVKDMLQSLGHEKSNQDGWGKIDWNMWLQWLSSKYSIEL